MIGQPCRLSTSNFRQLKTAAKKVTNPCSIVFGTAHTISVNYLAVVIRWSIRHLNWRMKMSQFVMEQSGKVFHLRIWQISPGWLSVRNEVARLSWRQRESIRSLSNVRGALHHAYRTPIQLRSVLKKKSTRQNAPLWTSWSFITKTLNFMKIVGIKWAKTLGRPPVEALKTLISLSQKLA